MRPGLDVMIVLHTLDAEGTQIMALALCREWIKQGRRVAVAVVQNRTDAMLERFHDIGVEVHRMALRKDGKGFYFQLFQRFAALCRRLNPQFVLSMLLGWHSVLAAASRASGVRQVIAHAGNYPPTSRTRELMLLGVWCWGGIPNTKRIVACSDYVRSGLISHLRLPSDHVDTIHNGVELEGLERIPIAAAPRESVLVGMHARLDRRTKDQETLIRAVARLRRQGKDVKLSLPGIGPDREDLLELARRLGITESVCLPGLVTDVGGFLSSIDVFAYSVGASEGLGLSLIEALAAGRRVCGSDVGACREVLQGGNFGELVPQGDPQALADAITRVASVPSERLEDARAYAVSRFSHEAMAEAYWGAFQA